MRLPSTSTERTYRYLRISIVSAAGVLAIATVVVFAMEGPITSISALFYTSGRTMFTGSLCAIALALIALSGHSVQQHLLDVAAPYAVLIAVIPTPLRAGDVPDTTPSCGQLCDPLTQLPGVRVGVVTLAIAGVLGVALALVLLHVQRRGWRTSAPACAAILVTVVGALVWLLAAPHSLLAAGHFGAAAVFFAVMTAVCVVSAAAATGHWRRVYGVLAVAMAVVVAVFVVVVILRMLGIGGAGAPWILLAEIALIGLFAAFWITQTVQTWNETNPALVAASGIP